MLFDPHLTPCFPAPEFDKICQNTWVVAPWNMIRTDSQGFRRFELVCDTVDQAIAVHGHDATTELRWIMPLDYAYCKEKCPHEVFWECETVK